MPSWKDPTKFGSRWWKITPRSSVAPVLLLAAMITRAQTKLDPAAWGSDHAGQTVPEFVHGDECLFCHRNDIGPGWQKNTHGITIRQGEDAAEWRDIFKGQATLSPIASQVEYYMGSRHRLRFLKKEGYGKFALLNTQAELGTTRQVQKWI